MNGDYAGAEYPGRHLDQIAEQTLLPCYLGYGITAVPGSDACPHGRDRRRPWDVRSLNVKTSIARTSLSASPLKLLTLYPLLAF
jgi:hypothetical protein